MTAHLLEVAQWDSIENVLLDFDLLEEKIRAGQLYRLPGELQAAADKLPADHAGRQLLSLIAQAIRSDAHLIHRHPHAFFQCVWNRCWWYDAPEAEKHYEVSGGVPPWKQAGRHLYTILEAARTRRRRHGGLSWLRSLRPPTVALGSSVEAVFRAHTGAVSGLVLSAGGNQLVTCSTDTSWRTFDSTSGQPLSVVRVHRGALTAIAAAPGAGWIATGGADGTLSTWDRESGRELCCIRGHTAAIRAVAISCDGCVVATASADSTVRLWNPSTGNKIGSVSGHTSEVASLVFSPDGTQLAGGSLDQSIRIWRLQDDAILQVPRSTRRFDSGMSKREMSGRATAVSSRQYAVSR
jgi:hypothetical protein